MLKYKDYEITYQPKPGDPKLSPDFDFVHREYDGREDGRIGSCRSVKDCMNSIDQLELDAQHGNTLSWFLIIFIAATLLLWILYV